MNRWSSLHNMNWWSLDHVHWWTLDNVQLWRWRQLVGHSEWVEIEPIEPVVEVGARILQHAELDDFEQQVAVIVARKSVVIVAVARWLVELVERWLLELVQVVVGLGQLGLQQIGVDLGRELVEEDCSHIEPDFVGRMKLHFERRQVCSRVELVEFGKLP